MGKIIIALLLLTAFFYAFTFKPKNNEQLSGADKLHSKPPNFETAFTNFVSAIDQYIAARNSSDSLTLRTAVISANNYLKANWSEQQIESNFVALWPTPMGVQANCLMYCARAYRNCMAQPSPGPVWSLCDEEYDACKANCHW